MIYEIATIFDINWLFFGLEKFKVTVTRSIVIKIISTLSIFIFVKDNNDLDKYILIMMGSVLISNLVLWKYLWKEIDFVPIDKEKVLSHVKPIIILFIPTVAVSLYHVIDKVMLGFLTNMEQVGFYDNSEKIILLPYSIILALGTVMLPRMSNLIANGELERAKKYIENTMEFVFFSGMAIMFGIIAVSPHLVPIFLGESFSPCIGLIVVLSPLIMIKSWANVIRTQYLLPMRKDKQYVTSVVTGAGVNLILNYMLIPPLGALGAVLGTLAAEFSVAVYQTFSVRKELPILNYICSNIWFMVVGMIMCLLITFLVDILSLSILSIIVEVMLGGIIYIGMVFVIMLVKNDTLILPIMKSFFGNISKYYSGIRNTQ